MDAQGRPYSGLPASLDAVERAWADRPDLCGLAVFLLPRLPGMPLASDSLKTDAPTSARLPMEDVVTRFPWVGMNTPEAVNVVWVESDRPGFRERVDRLVSLGLPAPAWIAEGTRGGHAAWVLRTPVVTRAGGRWKGGMLKLLRCLHSYLLAGLDGDRGAALRGMTKNPFSPAWTVTTGPREVHDLRELLDPLKVIAKAEGWTAPRRYDQMLDASEGRNCALFHALRGWARDAGVSDRDVLEAQALVINGEFADPLGRREALRVAKSVWRGVRSGRVAVRAPLSPGEVAARQAEAGRRTAAGRKQAVADRLERARAALEARGDTVTAPALAREAGVGRTTAWRHLTGYAVPDAPPPSGSSGDEAVVTRAEHPSSGPAALVEAGPSVPPSASRVADDGPSFADVPPAPPRRFGPCPNTDFRCTATPEELRAGERAMTGAERSRVARWERERFHAGAAVPGEAAFVRSVLGRLADLRRERAVALEPLGRTAEAMGERLAAGGVTMEAAMAAQARLRRARMAWAAVMGAELRAAERHHPRRPEQVGRRLWLDRPGTMHRHREIGTGHGP